MPVLMAFAIILREFWRVTPIICMPVTCRSGLWQHKANGGNRRQQQGRECNLVIHDVPPLRDYWQNCPEHA
jgi:hypothetical protein